MVQVIKRMCFNLSPEHIFYCNQCYDWKGKFIRSIGRVGQGPCEDVAAIYANIIYHKGFFYGNGYKIIEYDRNGNCTGKERTWNTAESLEEQGTGFSHMVCLAPAGDNLMFYNFPDTMYFMDTDYKFVAKRAMMPSPEPGLVNNAQIEAHGKLTTFYKDTVLFYNFYTDTIFTVNSTNTFPALGGRTERRIANCQGNGIYRIRCFMCRGFSGLQERNYRVCGNPQDNGWQICGACRI